MSTAPVSHKRELKWIPVERIIKNENNPRAADAFTEEELATLRASITTHGVLNPVVVAPYDDDMYELIDGERRWNSARYEGVKELPAVVINKLDDHDQVVVMFNIHTQHRGWEMAEQMAAIKRLRERNGHLSEAALAQELGMSHATLKDRLRVLGMGEAVVVDIGAEKLDYSSALRVDQITTTLAHKRPELVKKLGGEHAVERSLLTKAKVRRRGISQELVEVRKYLRDPKGISDKVVERYINEPESKMRDLLGHESGARTHRKVEELSDKLIRIEREVRHFKLDGMRETDLRALRRALVGISEAAQSLEVKVVHALAG